MQASEAINNIPSRVRSKNGTHANYMHLFVSMKHKNRCSICLYQEQPFSAFFIHWPYNSVGFSSGSFVIEYISDPDIIFRILKLFKTPRPVVTLCLPVLRSRKTSSNLRTSAAYAREARGSILSSAQSGCSWCWWSEHGTKRNLSLPCLKKRTGGKQRWFLNKEPLILEVVFELKESDNRQWNEP